MRKVIYMIMAVCLLLFITTCGASASSDPGLSSTTGQEEVVYFTSDISPEGMLAVFEALGWTPTGNVAVKLSTGETQVPEMDLQCRKNMVQFLRKVSDSGQIKKGSLYKR